MKPKIYREVIDNLVAMCQHESGNTSAERVKSGIWNANAKPDFLPDQYAINEMLGRLSVPDRGIIANMLAREIERGVFETLKALEASQIPPFEDGYEGSPYNDFMGRLNGWSWPKY